MTAPKRVKRAKRNDIGQGHEDSLLVRKVDARLLD